MEQQPTKKIGIIGTGDYARALCKRLLFSGYDVTIGSRKPAERCLSEIDETLQDVAVKTVERCLTDNAVVFLAVHHGNHEELLSPYKEELRDKIIVDISNRERPSKSESNAENLSAMLPWSHVVKAFNTVSAYAMESDQFGGSRRVFVAGDRAEDRERIGCVARDMGFSPVDCGALRASRRLEAYPLKLMAGWGRPTLFTVVVFLFWSLVTTLQYVVYYTIHPGPIFWLGNIPLAVLNKPICITAITLLALTYLPGCLASFLQMYNGTKYKRFPDWMDRWMKERKQLGMYALLFSVLHVVISSIIMAPGYYSSMYESSTRVLSSNSTELHLGVVMTWKGETTILVGLLALTIMGLLGFTTLPSVTESLNWREWRFWQSQLGYVTLVLATGHVLVYSIPTWLLLPVWKALLSNTFLSCVIPFVVLGLKIILCIPCLDNYVMRIRRGWEKKSKDPSQGLVNNEINLKSIYTHI